MANTAINHDPVATFPGSSTNTAVVKWSGTSGNALLDSGVIIDGSNNVTGLNNVTATGYLHLTGDEKELRFYEGANYIAIAAPSGLGADYTFTLPLNDGAADEFLQTNGSGVLTWAAAAGTTINSNADNRIITGSGTANTLNGESNLTFTGSLLTLTGNLAATNTDGASYFKRSMSETDGLIAPFVVTATSTGNMVDTFGSAIEFKIGDNGVADTRVGVFGIERSGADNSGKYRFKLDNAGTQTTVMTIDNTGAVSMPLQPAFFASIGTIITNVTGAGTTYIIVFQSEIFDQNADFNGSNTFTAPITGRYFFWSSISLENVTTASTVGVTTFNASNRICYAMTPTAHPNAGNVIVGSSAFVDMDANDTCTLGMRAFGESTNRIDINPGTYFAGYLAV